MDLTVIAKGERTGRLTVVTGARAVSLEMGAGGRVAAVVYRSARGHERAAARVVVLATGALETPRLLLSQRGPSHPGGLANGSGLVGRYLMETVFRGPAEGHARPEVGHGRRTRPGPTPSRARVSALIQRVAG